MAKLRRLMVIAVVVLALTIGMAIGIGGSAAYADPGGLPNGNSIIGGLHANDHAAHEELCDDGTVLPCSGDPGGGGF